LLILDEPTNHLDLDMIEWLENYLTKSGITLLMVTHDRYFLDRVCDTILELEDKQLYCYNGNYAYYLEKRRERLEISNTEWERAQNLYRKELEWMRRMPQARGTKAKARSDAFYELEGQVSQRRKTEQLRLGVKASYLGSKVLEAKYISKSYGELKLLEDFYYQFAPFEKVGIVGANGSGKTTFLRLLMGEEPCDRGSIDIGSTVRFGYFSQEGLSFDENKKVIDVVRDIAEEISLGNGKKLSASQFLTHFLFSPEVQHNYASKLSGGEKRRLYLCTVLMTNPNFLVLDEPTNDLDILSLNILEEYLVSFKGCVLVVSHDRFFMDKIVDHLLVFEGDAIVRDFPGNYTQYREWKEQQDALLRKEKESERKSKTNLPDIEPKKEESSANRKRTYREEQEFIALEKEIVQIEENIALIENDLASGQLEGGAIEQKCIELSRLNQELDKKAQRWMELGELEKK
jgi:ATP-binding cassette subfamily F protein uup